MPKHWPHILQPITSRTFGVAGGLQGNKRIDKRKDGRLRQGKARGDVHVLYLWRQTMHHGLQQILVAQHHSRLSSCLHKGVVLQPMPHKASLNGFCGGRHELQLFLLAEVVVYLFIAVKQLVGKGIEVLTDVMPSLVVGPFHIIAVEIPIKFGFTSLFQSGKQFLFYLLQHVEPHKHISLCIETHVLVTSHFTIKCALVG